MKRIVLLLLPLALAACDATKQPAAVEVESAAPLLRAGDAIPGRYVVAFRDGVADAPGLARQLVGAHRGTLLHTYQHALRGFAANLSPAAAEALRRNPNVAAVEPDGVVSLVNTQYNATWGLDRIDQRDLPLNTTYTYYHTGAGVRVYVLDTGIRYTHNEFGGRAFFGFDAFGGNGFDCHSHGTHVAGTIGGTLYGVAKAVHLYSVRVLDCNGSGSWAGVIAGVDWVTQQKQLNPGIPMVANMSLGGGAHSLADAAVQNSIAAGVTYTVAAGNSNADACGFSPARVPEALTVGATQSDDHRWVWNPWQGSNWGTCVNIFAPGDQITSAWATSDFAVNTITGTSMAAPHAAGVAAMYLQARPNDSPATVNATIVNIATRDRLFDIGAGSPNRLLFNRFRFSLPPLTVALRCDPARICEAVATGGAGGNSWAWHNATLLSTTPDTSTADPHCLGSRTVPVTVSVADGAGQTASATETHYCI